jgi:hypothetical protein
MIETLQGEFLTTTNYGGFNGRNTITASQRTNSPLSQQSMFSASLSVPILSCECLFAEDTSNMVHEQKGKS